MSSRLCGAERVHEAIGGRWSRRRRAGRAGPDNVEDIPRPAARPYGPVCTVSRYKSATKPETASAVKIDMERRGVGMATAQLPLTRQRQAGQRGRAAPRVAS
jgi:hypothetical protein